MNKQKILTIVFLFAAAIGVLVSSYSTWAHYDPSVHEICSINDTFNCDIVNKSVYSEILGVPVALMGLVAYVFFFVGLLVYLRSKNSTLESLLKAGMILGVLFSLYLTFIEAFVLYTWCILCLTQQLAIIVMLICMFMLAASDKVRPVEKQETSTDL
ncbi:MAG: vitamin K epoxide reductase family protein [Patescibacteria group bacterium]